jgi:radical SAM protein with 4Fe4S-binding SPASM domain
VGKNNSDEKLLKNSPFLEHFFNCVENYKETLKIGFDSCMVSGILTHLKQVNIDSLEPCEAGRFSAFISEDLKMYPCSFMIEHFDGEDLNNKEYMNIWLNSPLFKSTRSSLADKHCSICSHQSNCLNGCPFLKEINLCK